MFTTADVVAAVAADPSGALALSIADFMNEPDRRLVNLVLQDYMDSTVWGLRLEGCRYGYGYTWRVALVP